MTAPNPVTNAEFTRTLGRVLRRPAFMPVPAFALTALFGEMAEAELLGSKKVLPVALQAGRFHVPAPTPRRRAAIHARTGRSRTRRMTPVVVLLVNAAATWFLTGLIWVVQVVHYPLFSYADRSAYPAFAAAHGRLITLSSGRRCWSSW